MKKIFFMHEKNDAVALFLYKVITNLFDKIEVVKNYSDCDICIIGTHPGNLSVNDFNILSSEKINFFVIGESSSWFKYFRRISFYQNKDFLDKVYVIGMEENFLQGKKFIELPYWKIHIDWFEDNKDLISLSEIKNNRWKSKNKDTSASFVSSYKYWNLNNDFSNQYNITLEPKQRYEYVENIKNNYINVEESFLKNIQPGIKNKLDFISNHLIHLPFENSVKDGYVTEKLFHGLVSGCINLYYGDNSSTKYFNKDSFFIFNDNESLSIQIEKIKEVCSSRKKTKEFLEIDPFLNNIEINNFINEVYLIAK
jgi:hypothetical protein